jgi:hypothetical protein
VTNNHL